MINVTESGSKWIESSNTMQRHVGTESLSRFPAVLNNQKEGNQERSSDPVIPVAPENFKHKRSDNNRSINKEDDGQDLPISAHDEMVEVKGNIENVENASISKSYQTQNGIMKRRCDVSKSKAKSNLNWSLACNAALNFVGSIGSAVEHCMDEFIKRTMTPPTTKHNSTGDELLGMETFDTLEVQLLNDMQLYNRMNSWETNGTFTTVGTLNTEVAMDMNSFVSSSDFSPRNSKAETGDLSTNLDKTTLEKNKKNKPKEKKTRRVVNFEYPPISSMKECPRLTEEEKKKLFFTEEELDLYEEDRKQILCDDIEVIAVEFTDSEDNSEHEERCDQESKRSETHTSPRMGGDSKRSSKSASLRAGICSKSSLENLDTTRNSACNKLHHKKYPTKHRSKNDVLKSSHKRDKDGMGKGGKMKGVQIFLRQRSLG